MATGPLQIKYTLVHTNAEQLSGKFRCNLLYKVCKEVTILGFIMYTVRNKYL
jgi:hypothetical protein